MPQWPPQYPWWLLLSKIEGSVTRRNRRALPRHIVSSNTRSNLRRLPKFYETNFFHGAILDGDFRKLPFRATARTRYRAGTQHHIGRSSGRTVQQFGYMGMPMNRHLRHRVARLQYICAARQNRAQIRWRMRHEKTHSANTGGRHCSDRFAIFGIVVIAQHSTHRRKPTKLEHYSWTANVARMNDEVAVGQFRIRVF